MTSESRLGKTVSLQDCDTVFNPVCGQEEYLEPRGFLAGSKIASRCSTPGEKMSLRIMRAVGERAAWWDRESFGIGGGKCRSWRSERA